MLILNAIFNISGQFLVFQLEDFQEDFRRKLRTALMLSVPFHLSYNSVHYNVPHFTVLMRIYVQIKLRIR